MKNWWYFYFGLVVPDKRSLASLRWWVGTLILDVLVRPILDRYRSDIPFWRVHAHYHPNEHEEWPGHWFRFAAYTTEAIADDITKEIERSMALRMLRDHGLVEDYRRQREPESGIEGSCAKAPWPPELKTAWPHYMMGASMMLLDLVERLKGQTTAPNLSADLKELEGFYKPLHDQMIAIWGKYGSRAFLHHLSVLFAYEPIVVKLRELPTLIMRL